MPDADRRYLALIGDIEASREHEDRSALQRRFDEAIATAVDRLSGPARPVSGPTITTGDEFQALFEDAGGVVAFTATLVDEMHPVRLRFGLEWGTLETELQDEAVGMDGPCFHRARAALETATDEGARVRFEGFGDRLDRALDGVADLIAAVRADWTDRQRQFATAHRELGVQQAVADRFDVSKSTVSESLASARAHEVREAERSLARMLAEATERGGERA